MNKLLSNINGGIDFTWDDIRWEQDAVREAFAGLLSAFGNDPKGFIISGCERHVGPTTITWSAGWIFLNGEILKILSGSMSGLVNSDWTYFDVEITYDTSGTEILEAGGPSIETYQIRRGKVIDKGSALITELPFVYSKRLSNSINEMNKSESTDWIDGHPSAFAENVWYRKDSCGFVHLKGFFEGGKVIRFILPEGFRPANNYTFDILAISKNILNPSSIKKIYIETDGNVLSTVDDTDTINIVVLQGISFKSA